MCLWQPSLLFVLPSLHDCIVFFPNTSTYLSDWCPFLWKNFSQRYDNDMNLFIPALAFSFSFSFSFSLLTYSSNVLPYHCELSSCTHCIYHFHIQPLSHNTFWSLKFICIFFHQSLGIMKKILFSHVGNFLSWNTYFCIIAFYLSI